MAIDAKQSFLNLIESKGAELLTVAAILGHDKLDTTMTYVMNNNEDTHADYRRYAS